jgi:zinc transport system substrate-binding protein
MHLLARAGKVYFCISLLFYALLCLAVPATGKSTIRVVATLFPLEEFARAVGGERVQVDLLLPPGAEPHDWEPRPSDVIRISKADVFIYSSAQMEPWVHDIIKAVGNSSMEVVEASRGLELISGADQDSTIESSGGEKVGAFDPHVWLDFENDAAIMDKIVPVFSAKDPEGASLYRENARKYTQQLRALDARYREALLKCQRRELVFGGHAAFAYLAKRYGLKQISLYGLSPDSEPTPKHLAKVMAIAREHQVRAIYVEPFVSDKLARVLASEVGAEILVLNPAENRTLEQQRAGVSFMSIMEENLQSLKKGLGCE